MTNRRTRILVIDSEPRIERQLSRLLDETHFDIQRVSTGNDGVILARTLPPDCIVLSADLPDGFVHARKLKIDEHLSQIPLILTTGSLDSDTLTKHRKLPSHADAYVTLPIPDPDLLHTVAKLLPGFSNAESQDGQEIDDLDDMIDLEFVDDDSGEDAAEVVPTTNRMENDSPFADQFLPEPTLPGADLPPYDPESTRGNAGLSRPASRQRTFTPIQPTLMIPNAAKDDSGEVFALRDELKLSQLLLRQREDQILALQTQLDNARRTARDVEAIHRQKLPQNAESPPPLPPRNIPHAEESRAAEINQLLAEHDAKWSQQLQQKNDELSTANGLIESLNQLIEQLTQQEQQSAAARALAEQKLADAMHNNRTLADQLLDHQEKAEQTHQEHQRVVRNHEATLLSMETALIESRTQRDNAIEKAAHLATSVEQIEALATENLEQLEKLQSKISVYEAQMAQLQSEHAAALQTANDLRAINSILEQKNAENDALLQQMTRENGELDRVTVNLIESSQKIQDLEHQLLAAITEKQQISDRFDKLRAENDDVLAHAARQLELVVKERDTYQQQAATAAEELATAAELFQEQERDLVSLRHQLETANQTLASLHETNSEQEQELKTLLQRLATTQDDLVVTQHGHQESRALLLASQERLREIEARFDATAEIKSTVEHQNTVLEERIAQLQTELDRVIAEQETARTTIVDQETQIQRLVADLNQWQTKITESTEYAKILESELDNKLTELNRTTNIATDSAVQLRDATETISALRAAIDEQTSQIQTLMADIQKLEATTETTQSQLKQAREAGTEALEALEESHQDRVKLSDTIAKLQIDNAQLQDQLRQLTESSTDQQHKRQMLEESINKIRDALNHVMAALPPGNNPSTTL